jgi:hypothetical protein
MERLLHLPPLPESTADRPKETTMNFKKILMAAATATVLATGVAGSADAQPVYVGHGIHQHYGDRRVITTRRVVVDHRVVFDNLRVHRIRYVGNPYFVRGHYVVRSHDRFGRPAFVEVNPYTGAYIGVIRL